MCWFGTIYVVGNYEKLGLAGDYCVDVFKPYHVSQPAKKREWALVHNQHCPIGSNLSALHACSILGHGQPDGASTIGDE